MRKAVAGLIFFFAACGAPSPTVSPPAPGTVPCSDLARGIYTWEGSPETCIAAPAKQLELLSVGSGYIVDWQSQLGLYRVWSLGTAPDEPLGATFVTAGQHGDKSVARYLYSIGNMRVLDGEPRKDIFQLYPVSGSDAGNGQGIGATIKQGQWSDANWGHEVLALDEDHVLRWWDGTGEYAVWLYDKAHEDSNPLVATPFAGTHEALRRGARISNLTAHRLLEWVPTSGDYRIWSYHFVDGTTEIFDPVPVAQGHWDDPTRGDDILVVDAGNGEMRLLIWERATGHVRLRTLDPSGPDPMLGTQIGEQTYPLLQAPAWEPPTTSAIKNVVLILQQGRSFDSYFGQYCQAPPGSNPACEQGPACCEGMPSSIPGASACTPLDPTTDPYTPDASVPCMLAKIDANLKDGYATAATPPGCGDARSFVCAGRGTAAGAVAVYQNYASRGALADHFFQSSLEPDPAQAIIYLSKTAHGLSLSDESGTQITSLMADAGVPWALYVEDPQHVVQRTLQPPPLYYEPHWTFYRGPEEIQRDIDLEQLPAVSTVVSPTHETEAPGDGPAAVGIGFVQSIVDKILISPRYASTTLVIVAYLTSGGFYDHVPPPPPPPVTIDAQGTTNQVVPYGPRVPLLALGTFTRVGHISHVPLELSSVTVFYEWNWLGAVGTLARRDLIAANLGDLLDGQATGMDVPSGSLMAP